MTQTQRLFLLGAALASTAAPADARGPVRQPRDRRGNAGGGIDGSSVLTVDGRGARRLVGAGCDVGAYERGPCGDANGDGTADVADVFFIINFLFARTPAPPGLANVNGDSSLDVSDVFYLINDLFASGSAPSCPGT